MDAIVRFTEAELKLLEYRLTPSEISASGDAGAPPDDVPSKELVLKVGAALLHALEGEREVEISLTERECWVLRERVMITDSMGQDPSAGLKVKGKLYRALMDFDLHNKVGEMPEARDYRDVTTEGVKHARANQDNT